jgi:hypothetical protein
MKINNPFETYTRGMTARERRIRSRWALMFVISSLVAIWLMVKVSNQENDIDELTLKIEELTQKNSELHDEYFHTSTVNGRYELSLEFLKEINPKAAKDFEEFYNHQTE